MSPEELEVALRNMTDEEVVRHCQSALDVGEQDANSIIVARLLQIIDELQTEGEYEEDE